MKDTILPQRSAVTRYTVPPTGSPLASVGWWQPCRCAPGLPSATAAASRWHDRREPLKIRLHVPAILPKWSWLSENKLPLAVHVGAESCAAFYRKRMDSLPQLPRDGCAAEEAAAIVPRREFSPRCRRGAPSAQDCRATDTGRATDQCRCAWNEARCRRDESAFPEHVRATRRRPVAKPR